MKMFLFILLLISVNAQALSISCEPGGTINSKMPKKNLQWETSSSDISGTFESGTVIDGVFSSSMKDVPFQTLFVDLYSDGKETISFELKAGFFDEDNLSFNFELSPDQVGDIKFRFVYFSISNCSEKTYMYHASPPKIT